MGIQQIKKGVVGNYWGADTMSQQSGAHIALPVTWGIVNWLHQDFLKRAVKAFDFPIILRMLRSSANIFNAHSVQIRGPVLGCELTTVI